MSPARPKSGTENRAYLGETIVREMRAAGLPIAPRDFEFWFSYRNGRNAALNAAADAITVSKGALTQADIERLHGAHLSPWRMGEKPETVTARLSEKLHDLASTLEGARASAQLHNEALIAQTNELSANTALTLTDVLAAIDRLTHATEESRIRYALFEARMDATSREVGALTQQLSAVRTECQVDPTTALPNRAMFDATLAREMATAVANRQPLSVVLCNLDYYAAFNENFGTSVGDQVLRSIGVLFKAHMRPDDTAARFGGDTYAAILPRTRASSAVGSADRFRRTLMAHELVEHPNGAGRVTVSIGVADVIKGDTGEFLLRRVGNALKVAKREGRNRVVEMTPDGPSWDAERRV